MKHIMTAEDDDNKPEDAPDQSCSNANGDGVGRDRNEAGRRKTMTPQQIEANQRNALLSTGPNTPEGKARVRLNALKHGILAQEMLLPGEDEQALIDLERRLWEDWQPVGTHEEYLVGLIRRQIWNLGRAGRLAAAILAAQTYRISLDRAQEEAKSYEEDDLARLTRSLLIITDEKKRREALASAEDAKALVRGELATFGLAIVQLVTGADPFSKLSRYETAILRSLDKAFEDLQRLQQARGRNTAGQPT